MELTQNEKWLGIWGTAISVTDRHPENYAKNLTLRYPITTTVNCRALQITLDNFCGTEPVTISHITCAKSAGGNTIQPDSLTAVLFGGQTKITLSPNERQTSDPISCSLSAGETVVISFYLEDFTEMRSGVLAYGKYSGGFYSVGDFTEAETLPMDYTRKTSCYYFLSDVAGITHKDNRCIIAYGDSITAGTWPDHFSDLLLQNGRNDITLVRKAASGTRILRQYDNITYDSYGIKGATRFPREIQVSGADTVLIQHGINDIIHPVGTEVNPFRPWSDLPTIEDLVAGLQSYLHIAKQQNLKVYFGTLLPIEGWRTYAEFREELRQGVNDWIRTNGEADGFIDYDAALRNPNNIHAFNQGYDSGDHLHPSEDAYFRMAQEAMQVL